MTKSSYAVALLFAGWSADAAAQAPASPVTADEAMQRYREWSGSARSCPASGPLSDEEIVVCGRKTGRLPERLQLPIEREPGEVVRHMNEPDARQALAGASCIHSCYQPVTVNPIAVILAVPKVVRHILGKDDD